MFIMIGTLPLSLATSRCHDLYSNKMEHNTEKVQLIKVDDEELHNRLTLKS